MNYPGYEFDQATAALLAPADHVNPTPRDKYHLVVVGAGPAGLISAIGAAGVGAKVALIERHVMGGDCLNVGCVPSKALLEYTSAVKDPTFDAAFSWLREVRAGIAPHDSVDRYTELGVDVFLGSASFNTDGRICVDGLPLTTRRTVICTGATAAMPPIPGLAESDPLTNESVFDLVEAPASISILGAGAIGCELATVFARLGVSVQLFEMAPRVLPAELPRASASVEAELKRLGVVLHLGRSVTTVRRDSVFHITARDGQGASVEVSTEQLLVALGRAPNIQALQLENAGVAVSERGFITTDARLRTSNKAIYAAGDCTAAMQFTHHADAQACAVVQNALFAPTARVDGLVVPRCTYTQPEVASVGASAEQLQAQGEAWDTYTVEFSELDRGRTEPDGEGFAEVYTRRGSDRILGATIVGHDAGEQLASICVLMSNGLGLGAAGKTILAYPTRSEYLKRLADAYNRTRMTPTVAGLFRRWLSLTG